MPALVWLGGDAPGPPAAGALDMHWLHEAGNALAAGNNAHVGQLGTNSGHAIRLVAGRVGPADVLAQDRVGLRPSAQRTIPPVVVAAGGDLQRFTQGALG